MDRRIAAIALLAVCIALALLLLGGTITPIISGAIFAVVLALLGVLSGGFRYKRGG